MVKGDSLRSNCFILKTCCEVTISGGAWAWRFGLHQKACLPLLPTLSEFEPKKQSIPLDLYISHKPTWHFWLWSKDIWVNFKIRETLVKSTTFCWKKKIILSDTNYIIKHKLYCENLPANHADKEFKNCKLNDSDVMVMSFSNSNIWDNKKSYGTGTGTLRS